MSRMTEAEAKRRALAEGAELEIGGEVFNSTHRQVALPDEPEAPPAPPPGLGLEDVLAQLQSTTAMLGELAARPPDTRVTDALAALAKKLQPAAPRAPAHYEFHVIERDAKGFIQRGRLVPVDPE